MKKLLIATSAVVGLGLVSADFAAAQLETSFSGLVRVRYTDNNKDNNEGSLRTNRTQVNWSVKGTTDSGLTYGGQIRYRTADNNASFSVNKSNIFFGGGFGKVTLGNVDPAKDSVAAGVGKASAGAGGFNWGIGSSHGISAPNTTGNNGGSDRILYVSPSFNGLTVAADAYTDDDNTENDGGQRGMSAGVKYSGEFADGSFNVAAGLHRGNNDNTNNAKNEKGYGLGADMTFGPISVGANYMKMDNYDGVDTFEDQKHILVAAKYNFGPGSASISYGRGKAKNTKSVNTIILGVDYTVAPGWSVYADVARNSKDSSNNIKSNTSWLLGTNLSF